MVHPGKRIPSKGKVPRRAAHWMCYNCQLGLSVCRYPVHVSEMPADGAPKHYMRAPQLATEFHHGSLCAVLYCNQRPLVCKDRDVGEIHRLPSSSVSSMCSLSFTVILGLDDLISIHCSTPLTTLALVAYIRAPTYTSIALELQAEMQNLPTQGGVPLNLACVPPLSMPVAHHLNQPPAPGCLSLRSPVNCPPYGHLSPVSWVGISQPGGPIALCPGGLHLGGGSGGECERVCAG